MLGDVPLQRLFVDGLFRDFLARGPDWTIRQFDIDRDPGEMQRQLGGIINATNPDLSEFAERGGKLIMYHGWSDEAIPAFRTIDYFDQMKHVMGHEIVDGFARLFLVPGMQHCAGGHGPSLFNNLTAPNTPKRPERDIGAALEAWVEDGRAPRYLVAMEPENLFESIFNHLEAVPVRTGLLCPHPQIARLRGPAMDPDIASSFHCAF